MSTAGGEAGPLGSTQNTSRWPDKGEPAACHGRGIPNSVQGNSSHREGLGGSCSGCSKPRILRPNLLVLFCGISCSHKGSSPPPNQVHPTAPAPNTHPGLTNSTKHFSLCVSRALKTQHQPTGTTGLWDFVQPQIILCYHRASANTSTRSALSLKDTIPNSPRFCFPTRPALPHSSKPEKNSPQKYFPDQGETSPIPITSW